MLSNTADHRTLDRAGDYQSRSAYRSAYLEFLTNHLTAGRYLAVTLTFHQGQIRKPTALGYYSGAAVEAGLKRSWGKRRTLTREKAVATVQEYVWRLQKAVCGRAFTKRQQGIQVVPVLEGGDGAGDKHLHAHLLIEVPEGQAWEDVAAKSHKCWSGLAWAGLEQRHTLCDDPRGWLDYLCKSSDKPCFTDAFLLEAMHLKRPRETPSSREVDRGAPAP
jgi:hypothetical protein